MRITKTKLDKIKAAFHNHLTQYARLHDRLPGECEFEKTNLPRCCGAQFISGLGAAKSYAVQWLHHLYEEDSVKWADPYNMGNGPYVEFCTYVTAKGLQMLAYLERNGCRPFMSCITASYQSDIAEALRKTGWKKAEDAAVRGNGSSMLTMWTKDARDWEVLTK
jgi:hypothetical protein